MAHPMCHTCDVGAGREACGAAPPITRPIPWGRHDGRRTCAARGWRYRVMTRRMILSPVTVNVMSVRSSIVSARSPITVMGDSLSLTCTHGRTHTDARTRTHVMNRMSTRASERSRACDTPVRSAAHLQRLLRHLQQLHARLQPLVHRQVAAPELLVVVLQLRRAGGRLCACAPACVRDARAARRRHAPAGCAFCGAPSSPRARGADRWLWRPA